MASYLPPLAQSESKARLMQYLNLHDDDPQHKRIYGMMKKEAIATAKWLMYNRETLVSELQNDPTVVPPFSSHQVSETAMHREILNIYENASAETRPYYDLAHDASKPTQENWLIRWMLWHVFRYRDGRNKNRRTRLQGVPGLTQDDSMSTEVDLVPELPSNSTTVQHVPTEVPRARALPYDPIRDV